MYSGFNTDYGSSEQLKTLVMLCYVRRVIRLLSVSVIGQCFQLYVKELWEDTASLKQEMRFRRVRRTVIYIYIYIYVYIYTYIYIMSQYWWEFTSKRWDSYCMAREKLAHFSDSVEEERVERSGWIMNSWCRFNAWEDLRVLYM